MKRINAFVTISCFMQGNNCFPISFAATPSLVPRFNALSVFAPELDASIGKVKLWAAFPSSRNVDVDSIPSTNRSPRGPPTNAVYELEANIPVIGTQRFQLKIRAEGMAELVIDGILQLDDVIFYDVDEEGEFSFDLSEATKKVLKRFRTSLVRVKYDSEADRPTVIVRPPLPTNIKLQLKRKVIPVLSGQI